MITRVQPQPITWILSPHRDTIILRDTIHIKDTVRIYKIVDNTDTHAVDSLVRINDEVNKREYRNEI